MRGKGKCGLWSHQAEEAAEVQQPKDTPKCRGFPRIAFWKYRYVLAAIPEL